jgi:DNA-binding NarL/FixJ family response regulator
MPAVRVVIAEDHALVRAGLRTSLEAAGVDDMAEASDGIEGLDVVAALRPGVGLGTVKGHIADILGKLSASDRAHASVTACRRGLIP